MLRTLNEAEYGAALHDKLHEEVAELCAAAPADRLEEAADVLEVLTALLARDGHTLDDIIAAAQRKRGERGGFEKRIWLRAW